MGCIFSGSGSRVYGGLNTIEVQTSSEVFEKKAKQFGCQFVFGAVW